MIIQKERNTTDQIVDFVNIWLNILNFFNIQENFQGENIYMSCYVKNLIWSIPTMWQFQGLFLMFLPMTGHK